MSTDASDDTKKEVVTPATGTHESAASGRTASNTTTTDATVTPSVEAATLRDPVADDETGMETVTPDAAVTDGATPAPAEDASPHEGGTSDEITPHTGTPDPGAATSTGATDAHGDAADEETTSEPVTVTVIVDATAAVSPAEDASVTASAAPDDITTPAESGLDVSDAKDDAGLAVSEAVTQGAAAESADTPERIQKLPRLLRYVTLIDAIDTQVEDRLIADIEELCPGLPETRIWATALAGGRQGTPGFDVMVRANAGLKLAAALDRIAVTDDRPDLRGLSDGVRLLCLPPPREVHTLQDHKRVAKALQMALAGLPRGIDDDLVLTLERFALGWAAMPVCADMVPARSCAAQRAAFLGQNLALPQVEAARRQLRKEIADRDREKEEAEAEDRRIREAEQALLTDMDAAKGTGLPPGHLVVARLPDEQIKSPKMKEIITPLKAVINVALPLVPAPPLHEVYSQLLFEFPYAVDVIDFVLNDLVGRTTLRLRPLLLVGDPGGGKSRFARRLGEVLGLGVWRTDASRSDGAVFGGTDKRWYSAEPCHPFLAVAQAKHANPMVLLDELEKAGTRNDYGRLWDCLLGFLEPETAARYPDPALQVNLDLSEVSYVATANSLDPLPSPIRDRFRVVTFPKPKPLDLDALLPAVIADLTKERNLDARWVPPLDTTEHHAVAASWRGGSVRRLRRIVEAVLRERDLRAARN